MSSNGTFIILSNGTILVPTNNSIIVYILMRNFHSVSSSVKQVSHLLLASLIVIGTLMIIPAILQTAAAYVWARQCRKTRLIRGQREDSVPSKFPSNYDKNLFLYRLLACISSLLVIIFESCPRLYHLMTGHQSHSIMISGFAARFFATYLIVIPFLLFFWNYTCSNRPNLRHLMIRNIFGVIVWLSIPISLCGLTISMIIHLVSLENRPRYVHIYVTDILLNNLLPSLVIILLICVFLKRLDKSDYGIFYEPLTFFVLNLSHLLGNMLVFIMVLCHRGILVINVNFANFLYIAYVLYHMSFSGNFVMATIHSVISEWQADKRRRRQAFSDDDETAAGAGTEEETTGSRRRNDVIANMQKQFNVAYRWQINSGDQSNLGDDDEETLAGSMPIIVEALVENQQPTTSNVDSNNSQGKRKKTLEDVTMHYNILKNSNHLKKPNQMGGPSSAPMFNDSGHDPLLNEQGYHLLIGEGLLRQISLHLKRTVYPLGQRRLPSMTLNEAVQLESIPRICSVIDFLANSIHNLRLLVANTKDLVVMLSLDNARVIADLCGHVHNAYMPRDEMVDGRQPIVDLIGQLGEYSSGLRCDLKLANKLICDLPL